MADSEARVRAAHVKPDPIEQKTEEKAEECASAAQKSAESADGRAAAGDAEQAEAPADQDGVIDTPVPGEAGADQNVPLLSRGLPLTIQHLNSTLLSGGLTKVAEGIVSGRQVETKPAAQPSRAGAVEGGGDESTAAPALSPNQSSAPIDVASSQVESGAEPAVQPETPAPTDATVDPRTESKQARDPAQDHRAAEHGKTVDAAVAAAQRTPPPVSADAGPRQPGANAPARIDSTAKSLSSVVTAMQASGAGGAGGSGESTGKQLGFQLASASARRDAQPTTLADQVARGLVAAVRQSKGAATDETVAVLRVHPRELGPVRLRIAVENDAVAATLEPTTREGHKLLESSLPELQAAMERSGIQGAKLELIAPGAEAQQQAGAAPQHDQGSSFAGGGGTGDNSAQRGAHRSSGAMHSAPTDTDDLVTTQPWRPATSLLLDATA